MPRPGPPSDLPALGAAEQQSVVAPDSAGVPEVIVMGEAPYKAAPPAVEEGPAAPLGAPAIKRPPPANPLSMQGPPKRAAPTLPVRPQSPVVKVPKAPKS